jgi:hypothetical protein
VRGVLNKCGEPDPIFSWLARFSPTIRLGLGDCDSVNQNEFFPFARSLKHAFPLTLALNRK